MRVLPQRPGQDCLALRAAGLSGRTGHLVGPGRQQTVEPAAQRTALKAMPSRCLDLGQLAKWVEKTQSLDSTPSRAQIPIWNINARSRIDIQEKDRCFFQHQRKKKPLQIVDLQGFLFFGGVDVAQSQLRQLPPKCAKPNRGNGFQRLTRPPLSAKVRTKPPSFDSKFVSRKTLLAESPHGPQQTH